MRFTQSTIFCVVAAALGAWLALPERAGAQPASAPSPTGSNRQAQQVQLAVPFGVVEGQLVISGRNLMFIDPQRPTGSFTISRDDVRNITVQGMELTVDLARPVQDTSGPTSRLVFRLNNPSGAQDFTEWFHQTPGGTTASTGSADRIGPEARDGARDVLMSFQVKHNHRIGSDMGKLLVTPTQINYESVTDVNSSRQWNLSDIKEVHRDGPYKIKIVPFTGNEYSFELLGQAMTSDQYQMLVDMVTRARISKH